MIVRAAVMDDIPILARHRATMFRDMGQLPAQLEDPLQRATTSYLLDAMARDGYLAWVAEHGDASARVIGSAGVQLRPILPRPPSGGGSALELGPEAIVLGVYVEPDWRRRGVAEAMMRALLDTLAARSIGRIVLHASDEGRRLYERLGFAPTTEMRFNPPGH